LDSKKVQHIFLISDSCFSRKLFNSRSTKSIKRPFHLLEQDASRWGLSSGKGLVSDGEAGTNSPFAVSLLDYLRSSQIDFRVGHLMEAVKDQIANHGYDQQPQACPIVGVGHDGGEFVFRLNHDTNTVTYNEAQMITDHLVTKSWQILAEKLLLTSSRTEKNKTNFGI
jgi:hypothetical protein